jgi:hypothetical protein
MTQLERQLAESEARERALRVPRLNVINAAKAWVRATVTTQRQARQRVLVLAVQELEALEDRYR